MSQASHLTLYISNAFVFFIAVQVRKHICRTLLSTRDNVTIDIKRGAEFLVAKLVLHGHGVGSRRQHFRGCHVAQIKTKLYDSIIGGRSLQSEEYRILLVKLENEARLMVVNQVYPCTPHCEVE